MLQCVEMISNAYHVDKIKKCGWKRPETSPSYPSFLLTCGLSSFSECTLPPTWDVTASTGLSWQQDKSTKWEKSLRSVMLSREDLDQKQKMWKCLKDTSFKMESGSPEGNTLLHVLFLAVGSTSRKRKDKNYLDKEDIFHIGISSPAFKKKEETPPCPSNGALSTAYPQRETTTVFNTCSSPVNFCSK